MKKTFAILGLLASITCIVGGIVTMLGATEVIDDGFILVGAGIYFIGKGIFVGPMLISNIKD